MWRQQQLGIADSAPETQHPRLRARPGQAQNAPDDVTAKGPHRRSCEMLLRESGIELLVIFQFPAEHRIHAVFPRLRNATEVNSSEPANMLPSRNSVRHEITSPGPKQPQLISIPLA